MLSIRASVTENTVTADEKGRKFALFTLQVDVRVGDEETQQRRLKKRFRDFASLHNALCLSFNENALPKLPQKTLTRKFDVLFLEQRQQELNAYLAGLNERDFLKATPAVLDFFGLGDLAPGEDGQLGTQTLPVYCVPLVQHFQEQHELHFEEPVEFADGVRFSANDVLWLNDRYVCTASGDASVMNRLDTWLNKNIKLPWEPSLSDMFDGSLQLWRRTCNAVSKDSRVAPDLHKVALQVLEDQCTALAFKASTQRLFVGTSTGRIHCFFVDDLAAGASSGVVPSFRAAEPFPKHHTARISKLLLTGKNEDTLVAVSHDKRVSVWRCENGQFLGQATVSGSWLTDAVILQDGRMFATNYSKKLISLKMGRPPTLVAKHLAHTGSVRCLCLNDDESIIYTGGFDNAICVWSIRDVDGEETEPRRLDRWINPSSDLKIKALCYLGEVGLLASGGDQGNVQLWRVGDVNGAGQCVHTWKAHSSTVLHLKWCAARRVLTSVGEDGATKLWLVRPFGASAMSYLRCAPIEEQMEECDESVEEEKHADEMSEQPLQSTEDLQDADASKTDDSAYEPEPHLESEPEPQAEPTEQPTTAVAADSGSEEQ